MKQHTGIRQHQHGFTLVEIMVVIVIMGLLATIVGQNVMMARDRADQETARFNVGQIHETVTTFLVRRRGKRELPTMERLITPDDRGMVWLQGYSKSPTDPWGNEYEIRPGDNPGLFEVISYGPDTQPNTKDDINSSTLKDG
jgi:general secretion pathway protein G